ncbi:trafficking protein particle complex subunit 10-like [Salvelinus fontinalis]|uniref:trafficking protein particle complex subunit 10-like n=1 Tax=Salvelinus fontinalis TaxID=8038 RepID=UPI002485D376|nr:trafficking protein particle complex subunit 10-like [Salvelinus fontinalis]
MEPQEEKPIIYTMENKPIVTCAGDQALFTSLYTPLAQQLPREPMEWRRSYGRAPRTIHLEANFVQFKEELLPKEGNKALLTFPFLHIYWTDCCDIEVYKTSVRDNMMRWQGNLRLHGSADWVIVVVETSDTKKKNKTNILPRSSLVDKIRNDFCNKQNDRCVVLSDPLKESSRSQESWSAFLLKLRTLLLMSFTQNLGRFEEDMRTLREKRNQPGWSFCDYFMVQEELAFVFEMLQQCEDALVQYDELDALFTQYVLNFGAGDGANWLGSFCSPVKRWTGLLLRRPIDMEKRDGIQSGQASLLELRSYLFCRQCTLLIFLQRPWEVTQRAMELLHNCVQELCLLEVSMLEGALDCWVFLSCLEVLHRIEGCCDQAQLEANVSHTVGLWAYATDKLKSLGYMCGLVSEKGPLSLELNRTVDLLAGLGDEKAETVHSLQSPYKKLTEALSSVEAFERHYLELSHAAVEMYRAIGRMRSAGLVGKSLAEFYMRKGDPEQAESFLQNALRSYLSEGWSLLVTHTRKQMAECQKLQGKTETYLQTSALLAGDANLTNEERIHFCQEILTFANQSTDSKAQKVTLSMSSFAQLKQLQFRPATATVHSGTALQVELCLRSLMPVAVPLEQLAASVHLNLEQGETNGKTRGPQRRPYPGTVLFPLGNSSAMPPSAAGPSPELEEIQDCSPSDPRSLNSTGMVCKNTHLVLRRHDSSPSPDTPNLVSPVPVVMDDGANMLMSGDVTLLPGNNSIVFSVPSQELGTYTLRQLCATVGQVQFILPHISPLVHYEVYSQEPQLTVEPLTDQLLAGLPQRAKVRLQTGHYTVKKGDALQLTNIDSMPILTSSSCPATILNSTAERVDESVLFIQSSDKVTCISLPPTPPYHTLEFQLEVLCVIPSDPVRPENQRLTNGEIRHRPRSYNLPDNHMTAINQRMSIDCPWSIYSTPISLTFYIPFKAKHSLLSAGNRKYIQVCLQNVSDVTFHLMDQRLTEKHHESSLELQSLNTKAQQLVCSKQSVYYVWDVRWKENMPLCLQCVFSASFSSASEEVSAFKPYHYAFQLERVTTLYSVRTEIMPAAGQQNCHSGSLCGLEMSITRLAEPEDDEDDRGTEKKGQTEVCSTKLMYKVADSSSSWVVYGRSSGLVSMPTDANANHRVQVELMPLFAGHLPFPDIEVFKYLPPSANSASQPDTDGCVENDTLSLLVRPLDDQGDTASIRSQGSVHSVGSGEQQSRVLPMPRLEPFSPGQVFNHSQGCQVLVLPSTDDHVLEINAT